MKHQKTIIAIFAVLTVINGTIFMTQLTRPLDRTSQDVIWDAIKDRLDDEVLDILWKKTAHYLTYFESLDGFLQSAGATLPANGEEVNILTDGTLNNEQSVVKQVDQQGLFTFSRRSFMRTNFVLSSVSDVTAYLTVGDIKSGSSGYGFKIVNSTLYGVTDDGTTENLVQLATISAGTLYNIEARYIPAGEDGNPGQVSFLYSASGVSPAVYGISRANLPSSASTVNLYPMSVYIKATAAAAKQLDISFFEYLQHRNILR